MYSSHEYEPRCLGQCLLALPDGMPYSVRVHIQNQGCDEALWCNMDMYYLNALDSVNVCFQITATFFLTLTLAIQFLPKELWPHTYQMCPTLLLGSMPLGISNRQTHPLHWQIDWTASLSQPNQFPHPTLLQVTHCHLPSCPDPASSNFLSEKSRPTKDINQTSQTFL